MPEREDKIIKAEAAVASVLKNSATPLSTFDIFNKANEGTEGILFDRQSIQVAIWDLQDAGVISVMPDRTHAFLGDKSSGSSATSKNQR